MGVVVVLWAPFLLKKGSFYIIGKQTSGFLCSQFYMLVLFLCPHEIRWNLITNLDQLIITATRLRKMQCKWWVIQQLLPKTEAILRPNQTKRSNTKVFGGKLGNTVWRRLQKKKPQQTHPHRRQQVVCPEWWNWDTIEISGHLMRQVHIMIFLNSIGFGTS